MSIKSISNHDLTSLTDMFYSLIHNNYFLCAIMVLLSILFFMKLKDYYLIKELPISKVRSATQGYIKLRGHAQCMPGDKIVSPYSQTACVWYQYRLEDLGSLEKTCILISEGASDTLFNLADETGHCVVDLDGATVSNAVEKHLYSRSIDTENRILVSNRERYRFTEEIIPVNATLEVIGQFTTVRGNSALRSFEDQLDELLIKWKKDYKQLLETYDLDHDGQLNPQEWQNVVAQAEAIIKQKQADEPGDQAADMISAPDTHGQPFLASLGEEKSFSSDYKIGAILYLVSIFGVIGILIHNIIHHHVN